MEDSGLNAGPEYEGIKNMEQELSQHHLTYIYQHSYDVRPKWYNVGLCLLLEPSTLDAIGKDFHTCENRYRECLTQWLKRDSRVKSMKVFIAALRNKIVHEENLANKLEERYATQGPLTDAEREVLEKIKSLRKQFYEVEHKAIELATQKWDVDQLLSCLRFKYGNNHIKFIQEEIPQLVNAKMVKEIFSYLDLYWSYLSTDLLKYILKELKDDESLQKLERLNENVAEFHKTELHVFCKVEDVDPASKPIPNENLHQLITKNDPEYLSGRSTLEDVEQFRKEFSNAFTLDKVTLCVSNCTISPESVQVFWSIPPSKAPLLLTDMQKHPETLKRLGLISATVDSTSVYTSMKENILQAVQEVKDTEHLGRSLGVPDNTGNEIRQRVPSDAKQREAFVDYFIEHDPEASWRSVICALDWMGEGERVDAIRHLAEPVQDPTLTMQNLCQVLASVEKWNELGYYDAGLGVPEPVRLDINKNPAYKTEEEKKEALLLYYLRTVPMASWQHVAGALHRMEEVTALKAVNMFLKATPAELILPSHNLSTVLDSMEDRLWYEFGVHVNIPKSQQEKIRSKYSSDKDRKQAAIDYLTSSHPALSWRLVANALYQMVHNSSHDALAKQKKLFPTASVTASNGPQSLKSATSISPISIPPGHAAAEVRGESQETSSVEETTTAPSPRQPTSGHAAAEVRGESQETPSVASAQPHPTTGEQPSLPELLRLKIPQEVGANYSIFGIFLLNDETGSRVKALKQACLGNPEDVMLSILQEWLQGKGLPVTWDSLVQTLRDSDLLVLADKIQASKMPAGERGREEGDHS